MSSRNERLLASSIRSPPSIAPGVRSFGASTITILNLDPKLSLRSTRSRYVPFAISSVRISDRDAVDAFTGRLHALSKAHDVLLRENWSAAAIADVMLSVLTLHSDHTRRDLDGPEVFHGPKAGLSVSLLLHELATNANKSGSLSTNVGRVSVKWSVDDVDDVPTLTIVWSESGGPSVIEPTRRGFGSRLIRMGISGSGLVETSYPSGGFTATFKAPMSIVQDTNSQQTCSVNRRLDAFDGPEGFHGYCSRQAYVDGQSSVGT